MEDHDEVSLIFVLPDQTKVNCKANLGDTVLSVAKKYDLDLEGFCGGCLACATCHVILDEEYFNKLDEADEAEESMLDLAFEVERFSRLGCQVVITKKLDGMYVRIPKSSE